MRTSTSLKAFMFPGAIFLIAMAIIFHSGVITLSVSLIESYYAAAFGAGLVLAWRFHSSRVALAIATLFLSERALVFFSGGHTSASRTAFAVIAVLLPLNFTALSVLEERGFVASALGPRLAAIFVQSVIVAGICRPEPSIASSLVTFRFVEGSWTAGTKLPQPSLMFFSLALSVLVFRFIAQRKPVESGFFWSLFATALAFHFGAIGKIATGYLATAGLILLASVIETSYLMAYHDELTGVPGRRAFNEAVLALEAPYAIAVVDIDHFKKFNDTYGHETGDHVLRLVAARLSRVTGGGKTYRCGGEEFSIIFAGLSAREAASHLELLRESLEQSTFRVRNPGDRRSIPRGPDRRTDIKKLRRAKPLKTIDPEIRITVSMGVAEAARRGEDVNHVIRTADEALYRAKANGRNRIEISVKARKALP